MEQHEPDSTADQPLDPWDTVTVEFAALRRRLAATYRSVATEHGPSEEEIKEAFATLIGAWDQVADAVSTALRDPQTRERLRDTASSFANALGTTITDLGTEIRGSSDSTLEEE